MQQPQPTPEPNAMDAAACAAQLAHRERQINAIRRITDALFSHAAVDDMVRETLKVAIEVLDADVGSISLHDSVNDTLVFRYVMDPAAPDLVGYARPASQGISGKVFRSGVSTLTQKASEDGAFDSGVDSKTGYRTESLLTVPVKRHAGRPIGVMQVLNARQKFDERDLEVLEVLCAQAASAIENAELVEQARQAEIVNVIGDISHNIKNMLTPIQSGIWMLEPLIAEMFEALDGVRAHFPDDETWSADLEKAVSAVREEHGWILANALEAADRVQAYTKEIANAIKGELCPPLLEEADLNATAREVAAALRSPAQDAGVLLRLDLDPNLPSCAFDRKQMFSALYNLVDNAIPETPRGGNVTIRTRHWPNDQSENAGSDEMAGSAGDVDTLLGHLLCA